MFATIWNYLAGYVIIDIKGRGLEQAVNRAVRSGVEIWGLRRTGAASARAHISVGGFYRLRNLLRGGTVAVSIVEKRGLLIALSRMRGRGIALCGWAAALCIALIASRCIWFIEIEGCDNVTQDEVMAYLAEAGVAVGSKRKTAPPSALAQGIMARDERIAWAGAELRGVVLTVNVKEAESVPPGDGGGGPADVVAAKDAVITRMTVWNGAAGAFPGDAVLKGDVLVSGVLHDDGDKYVAVRAKAEVLAKVAYIFTASAGPAETGPVRSGRSDSAVRVTLFGLEYEYPKLAFERAERETAESRTWRNLFLPLRIERIRRFELTEGEISPAHEELIILASRRAEEKLLGALPKDARLLSKKTEAKTLENGAVEVVLTVIAEENIAYTRGMDGKQE